MSPKLNIRVGVARRPIIQTPNLTTNPSNADIMKALAQVIQNQAELSAAIGMCMQMSGVTLDLAAGVGFALAQGNSSQSSQIMACYQTAVAQIAAAS
jgi:hypothetical protein